MQTIAAVKELHAKNAQLKAHSQQKDREISAIKAYLCNKEPQAPFCVH